MKRRDFFRNGVLASLGVASFAPGLHAANHASNYKNKKAKNIIFMVSDGMSTGTLNMADLLMYQKSGKRSRWMDLYHRDGVTRSLMETASANALVTDSAAAGSSWGGGNRVPNGSLNIGANGEEHMPILQKFKAAGKSVGCVTSVQITHATPASFCVNFKSRSSQPEIAEKYLDLKFDVMMGGGDEFFDASKRKDGRDLYGDFKNAGIEVVKTKSDMKKVKGDKPLLGVFSEDGLPYAIDRESDKELKKNVPSLAEMTRKAIEVMKNNPKGFAMQVEGGKVDWAAHANDAPALIYDQLDFDEAVGVALDFAAKDGETLVVITTDHGNSNPGLFSNSKVNEKFANLYTTTKSNEWILKQLSHENTPAQVRDLIEAYQGIQLKNEDAVEILKNYQVVNEEGMYDSGKRPMHLLAQLQAPHTSVQWGGTNHSGDHVELAMYGPGSQKLPAFIENYKLHQFMLDAAEVSNLAFAY